MALISAILGDFVKNLVTGTGNFLFQDLTDNVDWKKWKAQYHLSKNDSDFLDRYAETLVALKRANKPNVLLRFYGHQSVIDIFHNYWYGNLNASDFELKFNQLSQWFTLNQQIDDFSASSEIAVFLQSFKEAVNQNRSAGDVELVQKFDQLLKQDRSEPTVTSSKNLTLIPPIADADVIGRSADLENLRQRILQSNKVVLVNGMGGIGKTTLAKQYINTYAEDYDRLIWIEEGEGLVQDIATRKDIKNLLGAAGITSVDGLEGSYILNQVMLYLQNLRGMNLLIIDNATQSVEQHQNSLPHGKHWHVLLTSRHRVSAFEVMELGKLNVESAKELFCKHCSKPQTEVALEVFLEKLERHTLSIELFAKLLDEHHELDTVEELGAYLDRKEIDEAALQVIVDDVKHAGGSTTLYRHLLQAFDLSSLTEQAEQLLILQRLSVLPPTAEGHSVNNLIEWFGVKTADKTSFVNYLKQLSKLGWVNQPRKNHFGLHRLIIVIVNVTIPLNVQQIKPLIEAFTDALSLDKARENPIDKFVWIPYGRAVLEILRKVELPQKAYLQINLALILKELWEYQDACDLLEDAIKTNEQYLENYHPTTAKCYAELAAIFRDLDKHSEARLLLEKAIHLNERNFGYDHPNTARSYIELALVHKDMDEYAKAYGLLDKALSLEKHPFVINDPSMAVSYSELAFVLYKSRGYEEAHKLLEQTMRSAEQNFGEEHPSTTSVYVNFGLFFYQIGEYPEALKFMKRAVRLAKQNFGDEHPSTARIYSKIALVLIKLGRYSLACKLAEKAKQLAEEKFGFDHPFTMASYYNLAYVWQASEGYQKANKLLEKAVHYAEQSFGADHPTTAMGYWNLGTVMQDLREYADARKLYEKSLIIFRDQLGEDHPNTKGVLSWLESLEDIEDQD